LLYAANAIECHMADEPEITTFATAAACATGARTTLTANSSTANIIVKRDIGVPF